MTQDGHHEVRRGLPGPQVPRREAMLDAQSAHLDRGVEGGKRQLPVGVKPRDHETLRRQMRRESLQHKRFGPRCQEDHDIPRDQDGIEQALADQVQFA